MTQVNIHIAKAHLSELIQKALLGEEIVIARDNKPMVRLVPVVHQEKRQRRTGLAQGLITMTSDFNELVDDFQDYQ